MSDRLPFAFARDNQVLVEGQTLWTGPVPSVLGLREAVRRMAGALSPPTQIFGPPDCAGLGRNEMLSKFTCSPRNDGACAVHSSFQAAMYSSEGSLRQ